MIRLCTLSDRRALTWGSVASYYLPGPQSLIRDLIVTHGEGHARCRLPAPPPRSSRNELWSLTFSSQQKRNVCLSRASFSSFLPPTCNTVVDKGKLEVMYGFCFVCVCETVQIPSVHSGSPCGWLTLWSIKCPSPLRERDSMKCQCKSVKSAATLLLTLKSKTHQTAYVFCLSSTLTSKVGYGYEI